MSLSFTLAKGEAGATARRKVLVTGAAGSIGSYFAEHAHQRHELRLMVRGTEGHGKIEAIRGFGEVVTADLGNLDRLVEVCHGIDTVVHLAANPDANATWESLLPDNVVGTYNLFAAAKRAGCRRVVFASSIHAVSGYPRDVQVKTSDPVNPGDVYGVTKCFGEALGRYMAEQEGVSTICLRIGGFQPIEAARDPATATMLLDAFVSKRDLQQLIEKCIDDTRLRFAIFNAISDNRFKRLDLSDARELVGYDPVDDTTREHPGIKGVKLWERVRSHSMADQEGKSGMRGED